VHVAYQDRGCRRTRMAVDEIAKVGSPFRHNQRSVRVEWVAVIIWRLKVLNSPVVLTHCTHQRFFPPVPWYREDVSASGRERSCNFPESSCRIQDVLENVRGYDQIERSIRKSLLLQIFALDAILFLPLRNVAEIRTCRIVPALPSNFFRGGAPRTRFVNSQLTPVRESSLQNVDQSSPARNRLAAVASELIPQPGSLFEENRPFFTYWTMAVVRASGCCYQKTDARTDTTEHGC
jgi:hypothetical protein